MENSKRMSQIRVGDLVVYRGWSKSYGGEPLALVVAEKAMDSDYHGRIRVMWMGEDIPIQAQVLSVQEPKRVSTWVHPKYFRVVKEGADDESTPE